MSEYVAWHDVLAGRQMAVVDYILVGGGLQSGLIAAALSHYQPDASILLIEQQSKVAGNHTWSFHETDLSDRSRAWAEPMVEFRWPRYEVRVGGYERTVEIPYRTCSSDHFSKVLHAVMKHPRRCILTGRRVTSTSEKSVTLEDGQKLNARLVIDNRGPASRLAPGSTGGFQKFWGFEVELDTDWPHTCPIVMDDQLDQTDGFRFVYTLPMGARRLLVEDTRFSNTGVIDREECLMKVAEYLRKRGATHWRILREENGVLPMPSSGPLPGHSLPSICGGYHGGWYHAATGYSFPLAVQFAEAIASRPIAQVPDLLNQLKQMHAWRGRFARFLNRLLFELVSPRTRYQIFRRFYRVLGDQAIARFYGHRFTLMDAFRMVVGVPPGGLQPFRFLRSFQRRPPSIASITKTTKAQGIAK